MLAASDLSYLLKRTLLLLWACMPVCCLVFVRIHKTSSYKLLSYFRFKRIPLSQNSVKILLPDEPVFKRTAAALEDEVVEVGAAGDGRDVEDAGLLALILVPMLYLLHALRLLRSCDSLVTLVLAENTFDLSQIIL